MGREKCEKYPKNIIVWGGNSKLRGEISPPKGPEKKHWISLSNLPTQPPSNSFCFSYISVPIHDVAVTPQHHVTSRDITPTSRDLMTTGT